MIRITIAATIFLMSCGPGPPSKDRVENAATNVSPNNVSPNNASPNNMGGTNVGTSNNTPGDSILEQPLTGVVAGSAFVFASGFAMDLFEDGELWIELHSTPNDEPCARNFDAAPHIILSATGEPEDGPLGLANNITFAYDEDDGAMNDIATKGRLVIDGIQGEVLSGGLRATMGDHHVNGTFAVPVCSP